MQPRFKIIPLLLALGFGLLTIALTFKPLSPEQEEFVGKRDKFLHVLTFAGLTLFVAWSASRFFSRRRWLLLETAIGVGIFAVIDEAVQYFVPTRTADWRDLIANGVGIFGGLVLFVLIDRVYHLVRRSGDSGM